MRLIFTLFTLLFSTHIVFSQNCRNHEEFFSSIDDAVNAERYEMADSLANSKLQWCITNLGEADTTTAYAYYKCSDAFWEEDWDKVRTACLNAIKVQEASGFTETYNYSTYLSDAAVALIEFHSYDSALNFLNRSLEICNKYPFGDDEHLGNIYKDLANVYKQQSQFKLSLEYCQKALPYYKRAFGPNSFPIAYISIEFSELYLHLKEYELARKYSEESLPLIIKVAGENSIYYARLCNNIALAYKRLKMGETAISYFNKALKIMSRKAKENTIGIITIKQNIATCYNILSNFNESKTILTKCLDEYNNSKITDYYFEASLFHNIGVVYTNLNQFDSALYYLEKCHAVLKRIYGDIHFKIVISNTILSKIYSERGEYESALKLCDQSLDIMTKLYGKLDKNAIHIISQKAFILKKLGKYTEAKELCRKGLFIAANENLEIDDNKFLPTVESVFVDYAVDPLITTYLGTCQLEKSYDEGIVVVKYYDSLISKLENQLLNQDDQFFLSNSIYTASTYGISFSEAKALKSNSLDHLQAVFYYLQRGKSAVLQNVITEQSAFMHSNIPDSLLDTLYSLQDRLQSIQRIVSEVESEFEFNSDVRLELEETRLRLLEYKNFLKSKYPEVEERMGKTKIIELKKFQSTLSKNQAALIYFITDSLLSIHTVTRDTYSIENKTCADLLLLVKAFRTSITLKVNNSYLEISRKLSEILLPRKLPKNIKSLVIFPDKVLSTIPFEALNHKKSLWLDSYSISYSFAPFLWVSTYEYENEIQTDESSFFAVAPVFDASSASSEVFKSTNFTKYSQADTSLRALDSKVDFASVATLLGTEEEVNSIENEFRKKNFFTRTLVRETATEENLKAIDLSKYKYVHIATHGFVNTQTPELSGVILMHDSLSKEDGFLYTGELTELKLNARLVTLSACETGLGKEHIGEGLMGLSRALVIAGAKNCIVSLWKVADQSTSELMILMYNEILSNDKLPISVALQKAKQALKSNEKFSQPYYWSPFILMGK